MLSSTNLEAFIKSHNICAQLVFPATPTATVQDAALAMQVGPDAVIKSVLFMIRRSEPLLIIANGARRISQRVIADHLEVGKKQVRMATPDQVLVSTGYPVGGVPPFGHSQPIPTWIDPAVLEQTEVYGGGGEKAVLLRISVADLVSQTQAQVVSVCG